MLAVRLHQSGLDVFTNDVKHFWWTMHRRVLRGFAFGVPLATGTIVGVIDLHGLLPASERTDSTDVLNGIAYDAAEDRLFVTGKLWTKMFEIKLVKL